MGNGTLAERARLEQKGISTKGMGTYGVDENGRIITGFFTDEDGTVHPITSESGKGGTQDGEKKEKSKDKQKIHNLTDKSKNGTIKEDKASTFVPAKSIEEAEKFTRETLGIECNYKNIDLQVINEMNAAFKRGIDLCPAIKDRLKMVGSGQVRQKELKPQLINFWFNRLKKFNPYHSDSVLLKAAEKKVKEDLRIQTDIAAFASPKRETEDATYNEIMNKYQGVYVNNKFGKNLEFFQERLKKCEQTGYHPVGCGTIASIFDHEVAHVLDFELGLRENTEMQRLFNENQAFIKSELSGYAAEKDKNGNMKIWEFIAEGWAEYCNNPTPRKLAKAIGDIIKKEVKKYAGIANAKK